MPRSGTFRPGSVLSCARPWPAVLLAAALLGACGVGAVKESTFAYGSMGTDGGVVQAGDVTLVIPPGALAQPTTIAILPEQNPYPIQKPAGDPCTYTLLGPQYCCGPQGLKLLKDGRLEVAYDPALIPPPATETDLVLLLWDAAGAALVPYPGAVQDVAANQFVVDPFTELGHLAVATKTCPPFGVVLLAVNPNPPPAVPIQEGVAAREEPGDDAPYEPSGLYVAGTDGSVPPQLLPTDDLLPQAFLGSPNGQQVLFLNAGYGDIKQQFLQELYTVATDGMDLRLVAGDEQELTGNEPTLGWMEDGQRVFFQEYVFVEDPSEVAQSLEFYRFSTVPGDGSAPPSPLYPLSEYAYASDLRQSPDGALMLARYYGAQEDELIDVFSATDGTPSSQGVIPRGGGQATPRFLPDSSGIYLIDDDRYQVVSYAPDGTVQETLFQLSNDDRYLKDFVLAPNGDDYAYIEFLFGFSDVEGRASIDGGGDRLVVGSLSGGDAASLDLQQSEFYEELIFHPDGQNVFFDTYRSFVRIVGASDAVEGPELPVEDISLMDVSSNDGRLLFAVPLPRSITTVEEPPRQTLAGGLYVSAADGSDLTLVPLFEDLVVEQARWLRSIRRAPGMIFVNAIR